MITASLRSLRAIVTYLLLDMRKPLLLGMKLLLWVVGTFLLQTSFMEAQRIYVEDVSISGNETNDNILSGKGEGRDKCVSYNAETKTLTLNNAVLKSREQSQRIWINSFGADTVTVNLIGHNILMSYSNTFVITDAIVKITGSGSLESVSNAKDHMGIYPKGSKSHLIIASTTVTAKGGASIHDTDGLASLTIDESTVRLEGPCLLGHITLNNCYIKEPVGAFVGTLSDDVGDMQGIAGADGHLTSSCLIVPSMKPKSIAVGGVLIDSSNSANVLAGQGAGRDGCVRYDEATKTLTLDNASILTPKDEEMLYINEFGKDTVTVNLIGTNFIKSNNNAFLSMKSIVRITGSGSLEAVSTGANYMAIAPIDEGNLIISSTTITANGKGAAIADPRAKASLTIENSTVQTKGSVFAKTITLKNSFIKKPKGGMVKPSTYDGKKIMTICDAYSAPALSCVIMPGTHDFVSSLEDSSIKVCINSITQELYVSGLGAQEKAFLMDTMGTIIRELVADSTGLASLSMAQYPSGTYLVVTSNETHKVLFIK